MISRLGQPQPISGKGQILTRICGDPAVTAGRAEVRGLRDRLDVVDRAVKGDLAPLQRLDATWYAMQESGARDFCSSRVSTLAVAGLVVSVGVAAAVVHPMFGLWPTLGFLGATLLPLRFGSNAATERWTKSEMKQVIENEKVSVEHRLADAEKRLEQAEKNLLTSLVPQAAAPQPTVGPAGAITVGQQTVSIGRVSVPRKVTDGVLGLVVASA